MNKSSLSNIHRIKRGNSLLIKGPASISLQSGKASVFMAELQLKKRFIIPEGRATPVVAHEDSLVQIVVGSSGFIKEVEGNAIPKDWIRIPPLLKGVLKENGTIMVLGGVDSGKSSLSTLLANYFTSIGFPVSILDLDVGQSDIGLPATIGLGIARSPIKGLYEAETSAMYFVGSITPAPMTEKILKGAKRLAEMARKSRCALIVNTDGWLQGNDALNYKARLVETLEADAAVIIGEEREIDNLIGMIKDKVQILRVGRPSLIYRRTKEERRRAREKAYYKYLRNGRLKSFPLSMVKLGAIRLEKLPNSRINLLTGLIDEDGFMLGPGILERVDRSKGKIFIYSEVTSPVQKIEVGLIRIKENGCEIGQIRLDRRYIEERGNVTA